MPARSFYAQAILSSGPNIHSPYLEAGREAGQGTAMMGRGFQQASVDAVRRKRASLPGLIGSYCPTDPPHSSERARSMRFRQAGARMEAYG